jgi:histidinol-phosphate aminotransferase
MANTDVLHKLSSNESPLPPFESAIAAMEAQMRDLRLYPDGSCTELKAALTEHFSAHGITPAQIMVGSGANELLMLMGELSLEPGDEVMYCQPSFIVYRMLAQVAGAKTVELPLAPDGGFDLSAMLSAVTERTKLIFICNPNNPTGGVVTREEFADFMDGVPPHVMVVMDEAYIHYVDPSRRFDSLDFFDGKRPYAVLRSFSKIYGLAGARVGFGIAPEQYVDGMDKLREPFNVNTLAQAAACASLSDADELERRRVMAKRGRERLYRFCDEAGLGYLPSEANFVWVMPDAPDDVFDALLREGVIVRSFASAGGIRITVGTDEDTDATIAALSKVLGVRG